MLTIIFSVYHSVCTMPLIFFTVKMMYTYCGDYAIPAITQWTHCPYIYGDENKSEGFKNLLLPRTPARATIGTLRNVELNSIRASISIGLSPVLWLVLLTNCCLVYVYFIIILLKIFDTFKGTPLLRWVEYLCVSL